MKANRTRNLAGIYADIWKNRIQTNTCKKRKNYFTWYRNSTNQKSITILNIYSLNTSTLNFRKQTLLDVKWQVKPKKNDLWFYYHTTINRWDILVKNKYRQSGVKWHYRPKELNRHIKNIELTPKCTSFSVVYGTYSKTGHISGHRARQKKCKKIKINPTVA